MNGKYAACLPKASEEKSNDTLDKLVTEAMTLQSGVSWLRPSDERRSALSRDGYCRRRLLQCLQHKFQLLLRDPMAARALPSCRSQISCG